MPKYHARPGRAPKISKRLYGIELGYMWLSHKQYQAVRDV